MLLVFRFFRKVLFLFSVSPFAKFTTKDTSKVHSLFRLSIIIIFYVSYRFREGTNLRHADPDPNSLAFLDLATDLGHDHFLLLTADRPVPIFQHDHLHRIDAYRHDRDDDHLVPNRENDDVAPPLKIDQHHVDIPASGLDVELVRVGAPQKTPFVSVALESKSIGRVMASRAA